MTVKVPKLELWDAIAAMCKYCIYDPVGGKGTWREQVEACTSQGCPLYQYRPISKDSRRVHREAVPTQGVESENA